VDFPGAIAALAGALKFGINPSLDGIRSLAAAMGRPQDSFASVQITGTNGKSSVTRLTAAILAAEGLAAGAYTSPHLESYTERIELGGEPCSEADFALAVSAALSTADAAGLESGEVTEFELLTAAALWLFRERDVDFACLEVGMGGRWDATSVVDPAVAVICGVGLDHTERLGSTEPEIASDKARIIKPGASVVLGPRTASTSAVFLERAAVFGLHPRFVAQGAQPSPVDEALTVRFDVRARPTEPGGRLVVDVKGVHGRYDGLELAAPSYQASNVATALAAAECALGRALRPECLRPALASMSFPGRFEVVCDRPPIVLDGAHNPQAAEVLAEAVREAWGASPRPWCVLGVLTDKDAEGIIAALSGEVAGFVVTQPDSPRALPAATLAAMVARHGGPPPEVHSDLGGALAAARELAGKAGVIVTGSLYTVGQARALLGQRG
jgi:dihydrofolate synthase / folylpolyglutamate synthase